MFKKKNMESSRLFWGFSLLYILKKLCHIFYCCHLLSLLHYPTVQLAARSDIQFNYKKTVELAFQSSTIRAWLTCVEKLDWLLCTDLLTGWFLYCNMCGFSAYSLSLLFFFPQHNPRPNWPSQPATRTGLPEERRGSLHSFRQMDKSAEHTQPSHC